MVKHTRLGYLKCWPLCYVDEKLISILDVLGHKVILLDQAKRQYVRYSLEVIPDRIRIAGEVANYFGMCHSYATIDM